MHELNLCFVYLAVNYLEIVVQLLSFPSFPFFPFFLSASIVFNVPAKFWATGTSSCDEPVECVQALECLHMSPAKVCVLVLVSSVQLLVVLDHWMSTFLERYLPFTSSPLILLGLDFTKAAPPLRNLHVMCGENLLQLIETVQHCKYQSVSPETQLEWSTNTEVLPIQLYPHRRLKSFNIWT